MLRGFPQAASSGGLTTNTDTGRQAARVVQDASNVRCKTKAVMAIHISGWTVHDSYFFIPLVEATAGHFRLSEVAADKAYLGRNNMRAVELAGGTPFIPFKKSTREPTDDSIWTRMYHLFMLNREVFMEHYHKRSNAESAFAMIKGKFGDSVKSKSDTGQVNEVLAKVLCHNVCVLCQAIHELGIEPTFHDAL